MTTECGCGAPVARGQDACAACVELERAQGYRRRARGRYGKRLPTETEAQYRARLALRAEEAGLCVHCKSRPAEDENRQCATCNEAARVRREGAADAGLCTRCKKRETLTDRRTCAPCVRYISDRAKARREEERRC